MAADETVFLEGLATEGAGEGPGLVDLKLALQSGLQPALQLALQPTLQLTLQPGGLLGAVLEEGGGGGEDEPAGAADVVAPGSAAPGPLLLHL